jgi:hypothetical protein
MRKDFSPEEVKKVFLAACKIEKEVKTYVSIMGRLQSCDVSEDEDFKKEYKDFYMGEKVDRNPQWDSIYFSFMEKHKTDNTLTFEQVLRHLRDKTESHWIEKSFASKLLHTINRDKPIWDTHVMKALGVEEEIKIAMEVEEEETKFERVLEIYDRLVRWYDEFKNSENAKMMVTAFDKSFRAYAGISETKKIDFILWWIGN